MIVLVSLFVLDAASFCCWIPLVLLLEDIAKLFDPWALCSMNN